MEVVPQYPQRPRPLAEISIAAPQFGQFTNKSWHSRQREADIDSNGVILREPDPFLKEIV
jgi:hypothetical protein